MFGNDQETMGLTKKDNVNKKSQYVDNNLSEIIYLYVMASIRTGRFSVTVMCLAALVALYTAKTSLPSTRIVAIPYAGPRAATPSPRYCSLVGVEMA